MRVSVRQIDVASFTHADTVRLLVLQVPRIEVVTFSVEDNEVVCAAIIDIHVVVAVHRDIRNLLEFEAFWELAPTLRYFIHVIATSECHITDLPNQ